MKAVILAGGKATRLLPITETTPKCLLEIGGTTILGNLLSALAANNITDIVVVTGYHDDQIIEYIQSHWNNLNTTYVHNDDVDNTRPAYGLWLAREHFTEPIIYLNSDLLCDQKVINRVCDQTQKDSVTAIQRIPWNKEAVNVTVDNNEIITDIGKHIGVDANDGEFVGATRFNQDFLESLTKKLKAFVEQGELMKFAADSINAVIQEDGKTLRALDVTDLRAIEIDTEDDLKRAKALWHNNV